MTPQPSQPPRKRNLIIFLPDQQRADMIPGYGTAKVHAPSLRRLASESVVFNRAYVTQPVCSPSRASLMTGLWPHTTGCTNNGFTPDCRFAALPQLIQDSDYRTAYLGKWHLGREGPTQRGFQECISIERVSDYSKFLISKGLTPDHESGGFSALTISNLPVELSQAKFLERHACEFIERNRRDPFILVVAFVEPHSPYNGPFNGEHPLSEINLDPTASAPPPDNLPLRYRLIREWQQDRAIQDKTGTVRQFQFGLTPADYRSLKQKYLGLITLVDQSIGSILACVERTGLTDHTVIVHTSDHGDMLGAHQLFGKGVMFEEAVRVPYLLRVPGQRHRIITHAVSHIDFVPTLISLLSQPKPPQCVGESRLPLIRGEEMQPESVFLEWSPYRKLEKRLKRDSSLGSRRLIMQAVKESTRTVISADGWKLSLRDKDLNELYNLNDDPMETRNLYYSKQHARVIARCAEEIRRWQESTCDTVKLSVK